MLVQEGESLRANTLAAMCGRSRCLGRDPAVRRWRRRRGGRGNPAESPVGGTSVRGEICRNQAREPLGDRPRGHARRYKTRAVRGGERAADEAGGKGVRARHRGQLAERDPSNPGETGEEIHRRDWGGPEHGQLAGIGSVSRQRGRQGRVCDRCHSGACRSAGHRRAAERRKVV